MATSNKTENAARRLRVWIRSNRPAARYEVLAQEVGVPESVVRQIVLRNENVPEYAQHITIFLDAQESGDAGLLQQLARLSDTLPEPHSLVSYTEQEVRSLKERQRELMSSVQERPYCLITQRNISVRQCLTAQKCRDCMGCGATTRFCAECGYDVIAFAGSELCSYCLTRALQNPDLDVVPTVMVTHVKCLQSSGQRITVTTCKRMQNSNCGACTAISRVCVNCKQRRCRYSASGLCLNCHTDLFNFEEWRQLDAAELQAQREERDRFFAAAASNTASEVTEETLIAQSAALRALIRQTMQGEMNPDLASILPELERFLCKEEILGIEGKFIIKLLS